MYCVKKLNCYRYRINDYEINYPPWVKYYVEQRKIIKDDDNKLWVFDQYQIEQTYAEDGD